MPAASSSSSGVPDCESARTAKVREAWRDPHCDESRQDRFVEAPAGWWSSVTTIRPPVALEQATSVAVSIGFTE